MRGVQLHCRYRRRCCCWLLLLAAVDAGKAPPAAAGAGNVLLAAVNVFFVCDVDNIFFKLLDTTPLALRMYAFGAEHKQGHPAEPPWRSAALGAARDV